MDNVHNTWWGGGQTWGGGGEGETMTTIVEPHN